MSIEYTAESNWIVGYHWTWAYTPRQRAEDDEPRTNEEIWNDRETPLITHSELIAKVKVKVKMITCEHTSITQSDVTRRITLKTKINIEIES